MDNFDGYIADIYREMESELIASMKRNLGLHKAEEALTGLKYPQWQAMKLKEIQRFQRENVRIMGKKLKGLPKEVSRHMVDELRQGSKHELRRYKKALKKGYKPAKVMKDSFFKINDKKVEGLINALNNDLAKANTAVLRMMNDQYRQTIFKAGMFISNGVYTEEQAVKKAVEEFEKKGLNCIEYKNGRRVNIADYTSMAVRTANQRAYMVGEGEFRKSIGETLVIISRHSTSCPLCKPFENKVLIDDVYSGGTQSDGDYMLLSEAMAQGLYHPRCRHGLGTYYPELEEINGYQQKKITAAENETAKVNVAKPQAAPRKAEKQTATATDGFTKEQEKALDWYVSGEGQWINQYLRGGAESNFGELSEFEKKAIKEIESATSKPLPTNVKKLYRSVDATAIFGDISAVEFENLQSALFYDSKDKFAIGAKQKFLANIKGKSIKEKGFMSTSTDYEVIAEWDGFTGADKPINIEFDVPEGTKGADLKQFDVEGDEQKEILLAKNTEYEITDVSTKDGHIYVKAKIKKH